MRTDDPVTPPLRFEDLPELVTVEEMGAYLRISRNAAYELVKTGALRSIKYGRLIRVPKAALLEGSAREEHPEPAPARVPRVARRSA